MKILIVTDAWAPQINGVVRTLQTVSEYLKAEGDSVHVIHPGMFPTLPCPFYPEIRLALVGSSRVGKLIKGFNPDAIYIATEGPLGWATRRFCMKHSLPFTSGFHTRFPEYLKAHLHLPLTLTYPLLKRFHAASSAILVPTASMAATLQSQGFKHVKIWGRGVDTTLFKPLRVPPLPYPRPIVMNVGRVSAEKNLEAFLNLKIAGTKIVVGNGPQLARYKQKYPNTVFTGAQKGSALTQLYNQADVFVFPSLTDTFGLVMLEALACGVPVAAYPVTGPRDVLTAPNVAVLDKDLAKAIQKALKLSRKACRAFALTHSWVTIAEQFRSHLISVRNA